MLKHIYNTFSLLVDSTTVTKNVLLYARREDDVSFFEKTALKLETIEVDRQFLKSAKTFLEESAVLQLYAAFECRLFEAIKQKLLDPNTQERAKNDLFLQELIFYSSKAYERWKIAELLDLFSSSIKPPTLLGDIKNVVDYRNWLAHGKKQRFRDGSLEMEPPRWTPKDAYETLASFLAQIEPPPPSPPYS